MGSEEKPATGTREGSPNHSQELRRHLAAAACEPCVSVFEPRPRAWQQREHAVQVAATVPSGHHAGTSEPVPVTVVSDAPGTITPTSSLEQEIVKPTATIGVFEGRIGRAVIKVDGAVDAETSRTVLKSVRS